jgi:adenylate cyclase
LRWLLRLSTFRVALLSGLALGLVYLPASQLAFVKQIEGQLLDLRFRLRAPRPASDAIVLVRIDDRSLREIGRWPWSRAVIADLIGRLQAAGARTIALDLLLTEPEPGALPPASLEALRQGFRSDLPEGAVRDTERLDRVLARVLEKVQGDRVLAERIAGSGNVVLPVLFELTSFPAGAQADPPSYVADAAFRVVQAQGTMPALGSPPIAAGLLAPIPDLGRVPASLGHANVPLDRDGAARFELPVIGYASNYYPSFALEVARLHLDIPRDRVRLQLGRGITLGDRYVPTDESMRMPVNYGLPGRFAAVSVADIVSGQADPAMFDGKIALIGGTAAGVGDTFVTPFSPFMPGIERHATVVDSILRQDFLVRRQASALLDLAIVLFCGPLIGWIAARRGLLGASIAFGAILAGLILGNLLAFVRLGLWLNLFLPLAALALVYLLVLAYGYFVEQRQQRIIRAAFKHYLSPELVEQVAGDPSLLRLGGEQRELTVLFADIRGSTELAVRLTPPRFAELLNQVFGVMTQALFDHHGMLDRFTGDGVVAIFGAPLVRADHALGACRAALAMLEGLKPVRERWSRPDLPPLEIGIGINTGQMIIGNMGSEDRFSYTVIGDEAHLGARLESANKEFRTHVLISEATWREVEQHLEARELDVVRFRGLERPVRVFELLGARPLPGPAAADLARFAAGLAAYRRQDFATALRLFEELRALTPDDRPTEIYIERSRERLTAMAGTGV